NDPGVDPILGEALDHARVQRRLAPLEDPRGQQNPLSVRQGRNIFPRGEHLLDQLAYDPTVRCPVVLVFMDVAAYQNERIIILRAYLLQRSVRLNGGTGRASPDRLAFCQAGGGDDYLEAALLFQFIAEKEVLLRPVLTGHDEQDGPGRRPTRRAGLA